MAFPHPDKVIDLMGYTFKDKITGFVGVVTSVAFDLYGCVQASIHKGLDKDGNFSDQYWLDINRLDKMDVPRAMTPPAYVEMTPSQHDSGPAPKPAPRAV